MSHARRETGYGDFCFGRPRDMARTHTCIRSISYPCEGCDTPPQPSLKVIIHETDGFKRNGTFQLFKLPLEIRMNIYRKICAPIYRGYLNYEPLVRFLVKEVEALEGLDDCEVPDWTIESLSCRFLHTRLHRHPNEHPPPLRPTARNLAPPPRKPLTPYDRKVPYFIYLDSLSWNDGVDFTIFQLLRDIGNTSFRLRSEFVEVLWRKSYIAAQMFNAQTSRALLNFFHDRPAVHSHITAFDLELREDFWTDTSEDTRHAMNDLSPFLTSSIKLRYFTVIFPCWMKDVRDIMATLEDMPVTELIRKVNVSGDFDVYPSLADGRPYEVDIIEEEVMLDDEGQGQVDGFARDLRERWLPYSLRYFEDIDSEEGGMENWRMGLGL